jgi:hypothetical protein
MSVPAATQVIPSKADYVTRDLQSSTPLLPALVTTVMAYVGNLDLIRVKIGHPGVVKTTISTTVLVCDIDSMKEVRQLIFKAFWGAFDRSNFVEHRLATTGKQPWHHGNPTQLQVYSKNKSPIIDAANLRDRTNGTGVVEVDVMFNGKPLPQSTVSLTNQQIVLQPTTDTPEPTTPNSGRVSRTSFRTNTPSSSRTSTRSDLSDSENDSPRTSPEKVGVPRASTPSGTRPPLVPVGARSSTPTGTRPPLRLGKRPN